MFGRNARTKTNIPIPPIQWLKLRQNNNPLLIDSISERIVEPVVVKPDTVSKKASKKLGISLLIINGRHPKRLIKIQLRLTIINPSFAKKELLSFLMKNISIELIRTKINMEIIKGKYSDLS
jgi:hypothetical protein